MLSCVAAAGVVMMQFVSGRKTGYFALLLGRLWLECTAVTPPRAKESARGVDDASSNNNKNSMIFVSFYLVAAATVCHLH